MTTTGPGYGIDHDISGPLARYAFKVKSLEVKAGYFNLTQERPESPNSWK